jgi:hypothetical protein
MSNVFANGLEISGKAVQAKTLAAFPDVCFTPPQTPATPPGVPIPYPSFGMASDTENGTGTVFIGGKTVNIKNKSGEKKTTGTEAGSSPKKGIITSKDTGKNYFHKWSNNVKFEGEPVIRFSDLATHNHATPGGNTLTWPEVAKANPPHQPEDESCPCCRNICATIGGVPSTPFSRNCWRTRGPATVSSLGKPLDLQYVISACLEEILPARLGYRFVEIRPYLEATTGADLSGCFVRDDLDQNLARYELELLYDRTDFGAFERGARYFFGHLIDG